MKKVSTSISRALKSDFKAFERQGKKMFKLSWGLKGEVEQASKLNEDTGEYELTDEIKESEWCTYESCIYKGVLTRNILDSDIMAYAERHATVQEYHAIYTGLGLTDEQQYSVLLQKLKDDIAWFDKSKAVNCCIIEYNGMSISYWADKHERDSLKGTLDDFIGLGKESYRLDLRNAGVSINISCSELKKMLMNLEVYAAECYNKTTDHLFKANSLVTINEVLAYDYKTDYPEKLTFKL